MTTPDITRIEAAHERLKGVVRETPLLSSPFLDEIAGREILIKAECLQHTGSFKFRGAYAALSALPEADRAAGVLAVSSGNHAQGIAMAATRLGLSAMVLMPADAPRLKLENTRALGAEVVTYDRASEDREVLAQQLAAKTGRTLIHPFDNPDVISGQASVGLEIAAQIEGPAQVLVPCGGGGLTSGVALALADRAPQMQVHPVEPAGFDDVARSLASGHRQRNTQSSGSLCDAIVTPEAGDLTWPILRAHCGAGLVVSDDMALKAVALAWQRLKLTLEPGGAVALAAALWAPDLGPRVVAVASGGNADPEIFTKALSLL